MYTRCHDHTNAPILPALCHTCQRINVEVAIAARVVGALFDAGYRIRVDDGEMISGLFQCPDKDNVVKRADSICGVLLAMQTTDMDRLWVTGHGKKGGWVLFVYGNGGWDVVSDYTTNLEDVLKPVNDYADTLAV